MMRKISLCLVLLCGFQHFLSGQITSLEHCKYWHYRQKLISDFLVIGVEDQNACPAVSKDPPNNDFDGSGLSIPACWRYDSIEDENHNPIPNHYNWGDGTQHLGWYIGVLATELRLLYNNNQDWASTQYELYCALKAYERLDKTCAAIDYEVYDPTKCNGINGMFIRDDVDTNLFKNYKAFAAKSQSWDSSLKGAQTIWANAYPSQDQMAYLFMGFALVKRCLNDFYSGEDNPRNYHDTDLVALALRYTKAIADRFYDSGWVGNLDNGDTYLNNNRLLEGCAFPFAWAATHITDNDHYEQAFCGKWSCPRNWEIEEKWKLYPVDIIGLGVFPIAWRENNDFFIALALCYAAVGQTAWDDNIYASIEEYCSEYYIDIYTLLYQYLYSDGVLDDDLITKIISYIKNAPYQGPMYKPRSTIPVGSGDKSGVSGWRESNRFVRPRNAVGGSGTGDFNGLDFMLLYNLFWLINPDPSLLQTRYVNGNILDTNNDINKSGSVYRDAPIHLASKIVPDPNTGSSSVYMKSSCEINLLGGFETANNTDILLEAKPMGNIDGSSFRTLSTSEVCNGFDFVVGWGLSRHVFASCSEPEAASYSWTVQYGSTIDTYSGRSITISTPSLIATYTITCTAIINGTPCVKTQTFTPLNF